MSDVLPVEPILERQCRVGYRHLGRYYVLPSKTRNLTPVFRNYTNTKRWWPPTRLHGVIIYKPQCRFEISTQEIPKAIQTLPARYCQLRCVRKELVLICHLVYYERSSVPCRWGATWDAVISGAVDELMSLGTAGCIWVQQWHIALQHHTAQWDWRQRTWTFQNWKIRTACI